MDKSIRVRRVAGDICDLFELLLDKYDITIPDDDRTGHTDFPKDLGDVLLRADAYRYCSIEANTLHIISRNFNAPLTDEEKRRIKTYLGLCGFPMEVFLDN